MAKILVLFILVAFGLAIRGELARHDRRRDLDVVGEVSDVPEIHGEEPADGVDGGLGGDGDGDVTSLAYPSAR